MKPNLKISTDDLRKLMHEGVVEFEFEKKDGSLRTARGTLKEFHIPEDQLPKNEEGDGRANGSNLKYWDMEKEAWRALSKETTEVTLIS